MPILPESLFCGSQVLVTGGLGFIGANLARRLVDLGAQVTVVDSLIPDYGGNLFNLEGYHDRLRVNIADVRDSHAMGYLIQGMDYLFNLAGQTSHADSLRDPFSDLDINCRAQLFILEACRRHNPKIRIVFASTRQIYGRPDFLPVDESHLKRPVDVNGVNKMAGEWFHILYNNLYDIPCSSLRLTNTYGPRMRVKDARQTFIGLWIRRAVEARPFEVWGGEQLRDFTYVDDAVNAMLLAAASDRTAGQVMNLGGEQPYTLLQTAELLQKLTGAPPFRIREFPPEAVRYDVGSYYADWSLIHDICGWKPETPLEEGLTRTVAYYREHLSRYL